MRKASKEYLSWFGTFYAAVAEKYACLRPLGLAELCLHVPLTGKAKSLIYTGILTFFTDW